MQSPKFLLVCLLVLCGYSSVAQRPKVHHGGKSMYTRERFNYNATRVRGAKAKVVCPIFDQSKYPYHGFGFKLGDPFALTYKYYANKRLGIVIDAGKPASSLYNRYYAQQFENYIGNAAPDGASLITFITHKVKSEVVAEGKILYHVDATAISPGLQLYVGAGWEWKRTRLVYDYTYSTADQQVTDEFSRFERSRVTMGPQLAAGIEYAYFQIPVSAFMELEYYTDIQADPGWSRLQGGVGLRYIF